MKKFKCDRSPWWLLLLVFLAIMATGVDRSAGTLGKPIKHLNGRNVLQAVVAVALCKPEAEVADIVIVERVSATVDQETKLVYRPVKLKQKNEDKK